MYRVLNIFMCYVVYVYILAVNCCVEFQVINFDDLLESEQIDIHKPFFCSIHQNESVKYFCNTCQVL